MGDITDTGYQIKTENEYFEQIINKLLEIDPNWNIEASSPDWIKAASDAEILALLDEAIKIAYDSKDPAKAKDIDLNNLVYFQSLSRKDGTKSNVPVICSGVAGTVIPAGKRISSSVNNSVWAIDNHVEIGSSGTVNATATNEVVGPIEANLDTITNIIDSIAGWQSVTNHQVPVLGTNKETNSALRLRFFESIGSQGENQIDSIQGTLLGVDDVRRVRIYENFTNAVDSNGIPDHSLAILVDGGTDQDVARAIFDTKSVGVNMFAAGTSVVVNVVSEKYRNNNMDITFSRPIYEDITIDITIQDDGNLPPSATNEIKEAVISYTQGTLIDTDNGFNESGFSIGEDVAISRFYTPINKVIGAYGSSYVTDLKLNNVASNVSIAYNELSRFVKSNIVVTINA